MKRISSWMGAYAIALTTACSSSGGATGASASAAVSAKPTASAAASATVSAVASASASAPAGPPVVVKHGNFEQFSGDYDGSKALFYKGGKEITVEIPRNCPAFSCKTLLVDDFIKACPDGSYVGFTLTSPDPGTVKVNLSLNRSEKGEVQNTGIQEIPVDLKSVDATALVADISGEHGSASVHGPVHATACPQP